jgi:predicted transcriptional regulator
MLEIGKTPPVVAFPDDQLEDALNLMLRANVSHLPIVDRKEPSRLLGMLSRGSIATAYRSALDEEDEVEPGPITTQIDDMRRRMRQKRSAGRRRAGSLSTTPEEP